MVTLGSRSGYITIRSSSKQSLFAMGRTMGTLCYGLDFLCFVALAVTVVLYKFAFEPFRRGFYCDDETINKPFKQSTIPTAMALGIGQAMAVIIFACVELSEHNRDGQIIVKRQDEDDINKTTSDKSCWERIPLVIRRIILIYITYAYGCLVNVVLTDVGKYAVGRQRPHFLTVCKPNWDAFNCTDTRGFSRYVADYECTGTASLVREARLSFPSGHASYSLYSVMFFALFLECRLRLPHSTRYIKVFLQVIVLVLGILCALSRISDFKHHWSDVLAGSFLGILVAFWVTLRTMRWRFNRSPALVPEVEQGLLEKGMANRSINDSNDKF